MFYCGKNSLKVLKACEKPRVLKIMAKKSKNLAVCAIASLGV